MTRKTILLVEDNPSDIKLAERALSQKRGATDLMVVQDGQEALDYIFCNGNYAGRDLADPPAVILLDLNLPKVDGVSVLREIKENDLTRMIPVVVLTTSNDYRDLKACYDLGCNSYIKKPMDLTQFMKTLNLLVLYWLMLNELPDMDTA